MAALCVSLLLLLMGVTGLRSDNVTSHLQFQCSNRIILGMEKICDRKNDCGNWDDECDCDDSTPTLCLKQPCLNGQHEIRRRQLCDGVFDCNDLSDECMCDRVTEENDKALALCQKLLSDGEGDFCYLGTFNCVSEASSCLPGRKICDGVVDCESGVDERFCGGPRNSSTEQTCDRRIFGNVSGTYIAACECDGRIELPDGSDEANCSRYLYCSNDHTPIPRSNQEKHTAVSSVFGEVPKVFVDWRRAFDGVADCPDARDEWHEYFVRCPEEMKAPEKCGGFHHRSLASPTHALKSRVFAWLQWFIGFVTIIANGAVMSLTFCSLWKGESSLYHSIKRANQVLVLSLSLSDFLLGVQMLGIAASDAYMSGNYWKYDTSWKSSLFCLTIGFLSVTLTQVSILTVVVISALRLYTLMRPFAPVRVRYVAIVALAVWGIGIFVAKVPTMKSVPAIEDYFVQAVAIPNLPQVDATVIDRPALNKFIETAAVLTRTRTDRSAAIPRVNEMKWKELEKYLEGINPKFANWTYFGYFSHTSMCLPTVIVSMGDKTWEYTLVTVVVDVVAYGFVVFSYVIVMRKTILNSRRCCNAKKAQKPMHSPRPPLLTEGTDITRQSFDESVARSLKASHGKTRKRRSMAPSAARLTHETLREKEDRQLQNRIFLLVFTDFICWAPILAFNVVNLIAPHHNSTVASKVLAFCFVLLQLNSMTNPFIYSRTVRKGACAIFSLPYRIIGEKLSGKGRKSSTGIQLTHFATDSR